MVRELRSSWSRVALAAVLGLLHGACAPQEDVTVTPDSMTRAIAAGGSDEIPMSVLVDDQGFQFVTLPAVVRMIGLESHVDEVLSLHADPIAVTLDERGSTKNAVVTVSVLPGTPSGEYQAHIVPDSTTEFLEGGDGLDLTVIVTEGGAGEPTSAVPAATPTPDST